MKRLTILLLLAIIACKSSKENTTDGKNVLIQYSKGPCMGKCPVYDFWVYSDGSVVFTQIKDTEKKVVIESTLSSEEIGDLVMFLESNLPDQAVFEKVRDLPVTSLKFNDMKYTYHTSRIKGSLKQVNARLEDLVNKTKLQL